jgi:hypothetical protein
VPYEYTVFVPEPYQAGPIGDYVIDFAPGIGWWDDVPFTLPSDLPR